MLVDTTSQLLVVRNLAHDTDQTYGEERPKAPLNNASRTSENGRENISIKSRAGGLGVLEFKNVVIYYRVGSKTYDSPSSLIHLQM